MIRTLVFDLDDTLVPCAIYYFNAQQKFAEIAAARTGLSFEFCKKMLEVVDGHMVTLPNAFGRTRFPTSFKATSVALDMVSTILSPDMEAAKAAYMLGDSVFSEPYLLHSGVRDTLLTLKQRGAMLVLNTKGDEQVQWMKIRNNDLESVFDHIYVTPKKDLSHYRRIFDDLNLFPHQLVFVGDSMKDDVIPPNNLGAQTIYVSPKSPAEWTAKWSYEAKIEKPIEPTWWVKTIPEILTLQGLELPQDRELTAI